jgi:hypothetical protein
MPLGRQPKIAKARFLVGNLGSAACFTTDRKPPFSAGWPVPRYPETVPFATIPETPISLRQQSLPLAAVNLGKLAPKKACISARGCLTYHSPVWGQPDHDGRRPAGGGMAGNGFGARRPGVGVPGTRGAS